MKMKPKKCKGTTVDTRSFGCGTITTNRKYGLCPKCLYLWSTKTEVGRIWFKKMTAYKLAKNLEEEKKKEKAEWRKKKQMLNVKGAMQQADTYFSRYIRLLNMDENGNCTCYTCGKLVPIKEVDNGHYQKREHKATRYHLKNCRPQCKTCNGDIKHNGKQDVFRVNLVNEIGEDEVCRIERLSRTTVKANAMFYRNIADIYRNKVNELQLEKKVKYW